MLWTRENVEAFGGDANQITIGGMSAGGQSIQAHSVMPTSERLYERMISISGPGGVPYKNDVEATDFYERIAVNLECCDSTLVNEHFPLLPTCRSQLAFICTITSNSSIEPLPDDFVDCILNKTTQEIQAEAWKIRQLIPDFQKITTLIEPFCPTYNSATLEKEPFFLYEEGKVHDKPYIMEIANEGVHVDMCTLT